VNTKAAKGCHKTKGRFKIFQLPKELEKKFEFSFGVRNTKANFIKNIWDRL
tara:strand:+ start:149 stop:301 length:153 start_codon:yes stop_codon:yes gene_type:complete